MLGQIIQQKFASTYYKNQEEFNEDLNKGYLQDVARITASGATGLGLAGLVGAATNSFALLPSPGKLGVELQGMAGPKLYKRPLLSLGLFGGTALGTGAIANHLIAKYQAEQARKEKNLARQMYLESTPDLTDVATGSILLAPPLIRSAPLLAAGISPIIQKRLQREKLYKQYKER